MAILALTSHLRRCRPSSSLPILSQLISPNRLPSPPHLPPPPSFDICRPHFRTRLNSLAFLGAFHSRAFSTYSPDDSEIGQLGDNLGGESQVDSELLNVVEEVAAGRTNGEDFIFPVRAVIWMLDGYHDVTGLPWWMIITSSTLALRIVLLPVLLLQLRKSKRIGEFLPRLPPPFPPPLSGRSFSDQFSLFQKERKAVGCPSLLWQLLYLTVQVPCFFLWMVSIRRMSLNDHPGFNCGGVLWFQDLTNLPHGWSGIIFPFLIAGLHYINVQISFRRTFDGKASGTLALLAKYYKWYLNLLTVPIAFIGFAIPQGSLLYWITNSSLTIIQQLTLRHPAFLAMMGLQDKNSRKEVSQQFGAPKMIPLDSLGSQDKNSRTAASEEMSAPKTIPLDSPEKWFQIPIENLSPKELTSFSVQCLSNEDKEGAISLLKLALDKDPDYVRALVLMGRLLLQKQLNAEATKYFEHAISKLSLAGHPTEVEDVDLLILASQWAGVACERQGKRAEGLIHFERVTNFEEPEDPACKAHYFDGLLLFASTLFDAGRKDEAAKYLRLLVDYNPAYGKYLERCEQDIASDLASSRREF